MITALGCELPSQQMAPLLDHFVGKLLNVQRHIQSERLSGLKINHKPKPLRLLDGEVGRFAPFRILSI